MSMERHVFVVFTNAVEGQENIYNEWYADVHLKDVLKVPGIVAAQRFKLSDVQRDAPPFPIRQDDQQRGGSGTGWDGSLNRSRQRLKQSQADHRPDGVGLTAKARVPEVQMNKNTGG